MLSRFFTGNSASIDELLKSKEELLKYKQILISQKKHLFYITFDTKGNILDANSHFLNIMGYQKEDVIALNHAIFCEKNYAQSEEYQVFWRDLKNGNFQKNIFKRITKRASCKTNSQPICG
ncbi:PAS domain-containing protein [Marinomonas sp. IMCC 4694]|uniref:PAS domain-containing protein n=1 Tax=Marinomonas sp. IMCC 4694 TaxID=2605432 RepID=UPI001CA321AA|nr:PAS domain-containing protein [Marinomonas sp. IMCC 4694]